MITLNKTMFLMILFILIIFQSCKPSACECLEIVDNKVPYFGNNGVEHAKKTAECYSMFSDEPYQKYTSTNDWKKQLEHAERLQPKARENMINICNGNTQSMSSSKSLTKEIFSGDSLEPSKPSVDQELNEVTIGNQVWMTENLNVDKFRNGDLIPEARTDEEWLKAGLNRQPAWCYYDNDPSNGIKYGKLYNWYAVNDPRGLAPKGWNIPTDSEWTKLTKYLGEEEAGGKMKSVSSWNDKGNGTNSSGFSGLPGGARQEGGLFFDIGYLGGWWTFTKENSDYAWFRSLNYYDGVVFRNRNSKERGFSVRCVKV
jgi:uncharacterized protein (TIGR02145 family)